MLDSILAILFPKATERIANKVIDIYSIKIYDLMEDLEECTSNSELRWEALKYGLKNVESKL